MDEKPLDDEALRRFVEDASHGRSRPKRYAARLWRQLRRNAVMRDGIARLYRPYQVRLDDEGRDPVWEAVKRLARDLEDHQKRPPDPT